MYRVGLGSDLHRLRPGDGIRLAGVSIPCPWSCDAVSDGDVVLHALADALLGACALGDIGDHFPESKVARGEDSRRFLEAVLELLDLKAARVVNVDCIIDLERPRLSPFKERMRDSLSRSLGLPPDRVNIKAKTGEGLGPVGVGQAVAAQVVALVRMEQGYEEPSAP